jgi:release factor glutamine methyltransferase
MKRVLKKLSFQREAKLLRVLDIFSGSGCIGIALLKNIKNCRMDFVDIDERAIKQIKINLKLNLPRTEPKVLVRGKIPKNRYRIYQSNIFEKLKNKKYNFIFANPPYVARERLKEVQPSVLKYEPKIALFGGKNGLFYIKKFFKEAKNFLAGNGVIFLEFSPEQKEDIKEILDKQGYRKYQFFKDQFKKYRYLRCSQ